MISLEKWKILATLHKLPTNVEDLGKFIVTKGFKSCPKIAESGHTDSWVQCCKPFIARPDG